MESGGRFGDERPKYIIGLHSLHAGRHTGHQDILPALSDCTCAGKTDMVHCRHGNNWPLAGSSSRASATSLIPWCGSRRRRRGDGDGEASLGRWWMSDCCATPCCKSCTKLSTPHRRRLKVRGGGGGRAGGFSPFDCPSSWGSYLYLGLLGFSGDVLWAEGRKEGSQDGEERKLKSNVNPSRPIHSKQRSNGVQDNWFPHPMNPTPITSWI